MASADRKVLRYPYEAITDSTDYLQIDSLAYKSISKSTTNDLLVGFREETPYVQTYLGNNNIESNTKINLNIGTVFLPIPSNIQDQNAVTYNDDSLNGIVAAAIQPVKELTNLDFGNIEDAKKNAQGNVSKLGELVSSTEVRQAINRNFAAQAVNIFSGNVTPDQILARQSGDIFNPNMELLFNGVTLRGFKFSFKMTPRDSNEAQEIRNIIRFFKQNMSPQVNSPTEIGISSTTNGPTANYNLTLHTPNVFQLTYKKGPDPHPFLHKFKLCALESISVNYTGENVYATYGDGSPISLIMDLAFKELEPIYSGDYNGNELGVGY